MAIYEPDLNFAPVEQVKDLMGRVSTCYLYEEVGIRESIQNVFRLFASFPGYCNYFPLRENCNPVILQILRESGMGVLVCCEAELLLARHCGFYGDKILYQPIQADADAAHLARELQTAWLLTSPNLLPDFAPDCVILRYLPEERILHLQLPKSMSRCKSGFYRAELSTMVRRLRERGTEKIGLSLPPDSYTMHPSVFGAKASVLLSLAEELREKTGILIWACQLGEGPSISYKPSIPGLSLKEEIGKALAYREALPEDRRPIFYTAMSKQLLEPYGLLLSRILEVRTFPSANILILDATACQYLRPALKQAYRHISVLGRNDTADRKYYHISGCLAEEFDRFGPPRVLPQVVPGDVLAIHDTGCGGRSMPMLYGMQPLCPEFLLTCDGALRQISRGRPSREVLEFLTEWTP